MNLKRSQASKAPDRRSNGFRRPVAPVAALLRQPQPALSCALLMIMIGSVLAQAGCGEKPSPTTERARLSAIRVTVNPGGPVVLRTPTAEFDLLPSGYLEAYLIKDGKRLTLDDPGTGDLASGGYLLSSGSEIRDFALDFRNVKVSDAQGKLGPRGKRVEVTARSSGGIEAKLALEAYEDFSNFPLTTVAYKNTGSNDFKLDQVVAQPHRLNASLVDHPVRPYDLWSFQGSSYEWGKDDVIHISQNFSQPNLMGGMTPRGEGGGIPVVAFLYRNRRRGDRTRRNFSAAAFPPRESGTGRSHQCVIGSGLEHRPEARRGILDPSQLRGGLFGRLL